MNDYMGKVVARVSVFETPALDKVFRIEFIDGSAMEARAGGHAAQLEVEEVEGPGRCPDPVGNERGEF